MTRPSSSEMASAAGRTSTSTGSPASMRRSVSRLASSMIFKGLPQIAASISQLVEQAGEVGIATGRGAPLHMDDLDANSRIADRLHAAAFGFETGKIDGKHFQA